MTGSCGHNSAFCYRHRRVLTRLRVNPANGRFADLCKLYDAYFGEPRQRGGEPPNLRNTLATGSAGEYLEL